MIATNNIMYIYSNMHNTLLIAFNFTSKAGMGILVSTVLYCILAWNDLLLLGVVLTVVEVGVVSRSCRGLDEWTKLICVFWSSPCWDRAMIILVSWKNDHTRSLHTEIYNVNIQCHDISTYVWYGVFAPSEAKMWMRAALLSRVPMYTCTTDFYYWYITYNSLCVLGEEKS